MNETLNYRVVNQYHYSLVVKGNAYRAHRLLTEKLPTRDWRYYVVRSEEHRDPDTNLPRETVMHLYSRDPLANPLNEWFLDSGEMPSGHYPAGGLLLWTFLSESTFTE